MPKPDTPESRFVPSGFFGVRSPALPVDTLLAWARGLQVPSCPDGPELEAAVVQDVARLRDSLAEVMKCPDVLDAIALASADLFEGLAIWRASPESKRGRNVESSLLRYVVRMMTR